MWLYLRRVPIDQLLMHPQLIPKKHFTNKAIATQLERAIKVASARCGGLDMDVDHDAHKFVACVMWVILGRHRSSVAPTHARTPWTEVVKERVDRLYSGEFEALFDEAAAAAEVAGPRGGQVDQVRRAVELAHPGKVSKAFGALASGGFYPLRKRRFETHSAHSCSPTMNLRLRVGVTSWYNREERILEVPCASLSLVSVKSSGPMDNQG